MIMKCILLKSQENNLHFDMTNNTVAHEWTKNENRRGSHVQTADMLKTQGCYWMLLPRMLLPALYKY